MGEEAQSELARCGTLASFPQRYVVVLEELRREAMRLMGQSLALVGTGDLPEDHQDTEKTETETVQPHQSIHDIGPYSETFDHSMQHPTSPDWMTGFAQDPSPASYLADMTGWGEFDSLVLTGLGELSHIFPDSESQY
jgi:galactonate dehydratase